MQNNVEVAPTPALTVQPSTKQLISAQSTTKPTSATPTDKPTSKPTGPPYAVCTHAPVFVARGLFHPSQVIVPHEFGVPGWEVVPVATGIEEGALSGVSSSVSFLDKEALENINKQFKTNLHKDAPFDFDTILAHGDLIVLEDDISDQVPAHTVAHT